MSRLAAAAIVALTMASGAHAVELPPSCEAHPMAPDETTPLAELRTRVESLIETDPPAAVALLCATIARAAREHGEDSAEVAWWAASLATPLIAFMDRHDEAVPLLDFARPILERHLGPHAAEVADIHVARAWSAFRQGRLTEARTSWENALRIREHTPGARQVELQKALVGLAHVELALRDFGSARRSLERARAILEANGETVSEAAAAIENAFTNLALREEDYAEARRHADAQIAIETKLQNRAAQLVPAYVLLGQILERLDEFEDSERALREGVRLADADEGPLQRHRLSALTQLAVQLQQRGRPAEALDVGRRALGLAESTLGPDAPRLVRVLTAVAAAHRALGELPQALHVHERAGGIVAAHAQDVERPVLVSHHRAFGVLLLDLGEHERAQAELAKAIDAAGSEPTLSTERAAVLVTLAASLEAPDARARDHLEEALALLLGRLPESHPAVLQVVNDLCSLELEQRSGAPEHCTEAAARIATDREIEPTLRHAVHFNQSRLAEQRADADAAQAAALRALAAAAALGTPEPLWKAAFQVARLVHARGDVALAIFFGKQSIAQIERLRAHLVGEDRRYDRGLLLEKAAVYRTVADWLLEEGRVAEGLDVLRLLKAEELHDFVVRDEVRPRGERIALTEDEQALEAGYERVIQADPAVGEEIARLARLAAAGRISPAERGRLESLLTGQREVERQRAERLRRFIADRAAAPRPPASRPAVHTAALEQDLRRFGPEAALAVYLLADEHLRVLVATRAGQHEIEIPVQGRTLARDIGRLLDRIARREDVGDASRALYDLVARPVDELARRAGAKRLVLWLDGALRYLPFGALHDGRRYLSDRYALEAYSEDAGPAVGPGGRSGAMSVVGLGVTRAVGGYAALPAVADELCAIVRGPIAGLASTDPCNGVLHGEGFADAAFTQARLHAVLAPPRRFSVLHLGTHFRLRPGNAMRSFLVLGDGSRLTLEEIAGLDFAGVELLTLSGCQTGLGGAFTSDGREVEGLSTLVQRRGAGRVVASLWQVEDESTARLMAAFYTSIRGGSPDAAGALQRAQRALREVVRDGRRPYSHPYYWAGFLVSGRGR